jgi:hypothetical protein
LYQVTDILNYDAESEDIATVLGEGSLDKVKLGIEQYLHGKGHPWPERMKGLIPEEQLVKDSENPLIKCQALLKALTGVGSTLPQDYKRFKANIFSTYSVFLNLIFYAPDQTC